MITIKKLLRFAPFWTICWTRKRIGRFVSWRYLLSCKNRSFLLESRNSLFNLLFSSPREWFLGTRPWFIQDWVGESREVKIFFWFQVCSIFYRLTSFLLNFCRFRDYHNEFCAYRWWGVFCWGHFYAGPGEQLCGYLKRPQWNRFYCKILIWCDSGWVFWHSWRPSAKHSLFLFIPSVSWIRRECRSS